MRKLRDKVRSQFINHRKIKVVYLGQYGGFHFGKVIEASARFVGDSGLDYPFPKHAHIHFQINDEDGDVFTVSEDGIHFSSDWYPVSDDCPLGDLL